MRSGVARRLRKAAQTDSNATETVVCNKCGQRFAIDKNGLHNPELAEKQVAWLQEQFVWDHIQERKHHGNVDLPNLS